MKHVLNIDLVVDVLLNPGRQEVESTKKLKKHFYDIEQPDVLSGEKKRNQQWIWTR